MNTVSRRLGWSAVLAASSCLASCGGRTVQDGSGSGGQGGAQGARPSLPGPDTRLVVVSGSRLSVLEFSDPYDVRETVLTEDLMFAPATDPGQRGLGYARRGSSVAWAQADGAVGAYVDERILMMPRDDLSSPRIELRSAAEVIVYSGEEVLSWSVRTGEIHEVHIEPQRMAAGGSHFECQDGVVTFVLKDGQEVSWTDDRASFVHPNGERLALVVSEVGEFESAVVDEIVLPEAVGGTIDCESWRIWNDVYHGPVAWSASGSLLAAEIEGGARAVRVGQPPLHESADVVLLSHAEPGVGEEWAFVGEDLYWIGGDGDGAGLHRRSELGAITTLARSDAEDEFVSFQFRGSPYGFVIEAIAREPLREVIYVVSSGGDLVRLPQTLPDGWTSVEPEGAGLIWTTSGTCAEPPAGTIALPCDAPDRVLFWPNPDAGPAEVSELIGDVGWLRGWDAFLLELDSELWFVPHTDLEERVLLASGARYVGTLDP